MGLVRNTWPAASIGMGFAVSRVSAGAHWSSMRDATRQMSAWTIGWCARRLDEDVVGRAVPRWCALRACSGYRQC